MNTINVNSMTDAQNTVSLDGKTESIKTGEANANSFNNLFAKLMMSDGDNVQEGNFESLLAKLAAIMEKSEDSKEDLLAFMNGLPEDEQQVVLQFFQLLSTTKDFNLINKGMQDFIAFGEQGNSKKTLDFPTKDKQNLELLIKNLSSKDIESYLSANKKSAEQNVTKNSNFDGVVKNTYLNSFNKSVLTNNQISNNDKSTDKSYSSDIANAKIIDLGLAQLNSSNNNISVLANKVEFNLPNQNIENLFVNKNFSEEFGKMLIKNAVLPNGESQMNIQLHPKELGQINVKLASVDGNISAQILVQSALGKELLDSHLHQLRQSLVVQGYQVDKIEVQQTTSSSTQQNLNSGFNFTREQSNPNQNTEQNLFNYSNNIVDEEEEVVPELANTSGVDYTI